MVWNLLYHNFHCFNFVDFSNYVTFNNIFLFKTHLQVSLRDPIREGADDNELRQIIGAAVRFKCYFVCDYLFIYFMTCTNDAYSGEEKERVSCWNV